MFNFDLSILNRMPKILKIPFISTTNLILQKCTDKKEYDILALIFLQYSLPQQHGMTSPATTTSTARRPATTAPVHARPRPRRLPLRRIPDRHLPHPVRRRAGLDAAAASFSPLPDTAAPGLYCASSCTAFPTPLGTHMTPAPDCRLVNTNECPADCDAHATCIDLDPLAPGAARNQTHECVCDDAVFPVDAHGKKCSTSGLELDFAVNLTAAVATWPRSRAPHDTLACLVSGGFAFPGAPAQAAVAIGLDYRVRVRLAMSFVRLEAPWADIGATLDTCLPVNVTRQDVCEREPTKTCHGQCAACRADWPAVFVTVVENALEAPVLEVSSFGYVLASLSFRGLRWRVEIRFDRNFFVDGLPFVFLTQKNTVLDASPVPCALGARNDNGTCCVDDLSSRFRIPALLAEDIASLRAATRGRSQRTRPRARAPERSGCAPLRRGEICRRPTRRGICKPRGRGSLRTRPRKCTRCARTW